MGLIEQFLHNIRLATITKLSCIIPSCTCRYSGYGTRLSTDSRATQYGEQSNTKLKMHGSKDEFCSDTGLKSDNGDKEEKDEFTSDSRNRSSDDAEDNVRYNDGDKFQNPAIKSGKKNNRQRDNLSPNITPSMLDDDNYQNQPSKKVINTPIPIESNLDIKKLQYPDSLENECHCYDKNFRTSNVKNERLQSLDEDFEDTSDNDSNASKCALSPSSSRLLHKTRQSTDIESDHELDHYYKLTTLKSRKRPHTNHTTGTEDIIAYSKFSSNISDGDKICMQSSTSIESYQRDWCLNINDENYYPKGFKLTVVKKLPLQDTKTLTKTSNNKCQIKNDNIQETSNTDDNYECDQYAYDNDYNIEETSNTDDTYECDEYANVNGDNIEVTTNTDDTYECDEYAGNNGDNIKETNRPCDCESSSYMSEGDNPEYSKVPVREEVEYQSGDVSSTTSQVDKKMSSTTPPRCCCLCDDRIIKKLLAEQSYHKFQTSGTNTYEDDRIAKKLHGSRHKFKTKCTNTNKDYRIAKKLHGSQRKLKTKGTNTNKDDRIAKKLHGSRRKLKTTGTNTNKDLKMHRHKIKEPKYKSGFFRRTGSKVDKKISPIQIASSKCNCNCTCRYKITKKVNSNYSCYTLETAGNNKNTSNNIDLEITNHTIKEATNQHINTSYKYGNSNLTASKEKDEKLSPNTALRTKKGSVVCDDGIRKEYNYKYSSHKLATAETNTNEDLESTQTNEDLESTQTNEDLESTQTNEDLESTQTNEDLESTQTNEDLESTQTNEDLESTQTNEDLESTQTNEDLESTQTNEDLESTQTTEDLQSADKIYKEICNCESKRKSNVTTKCTCNREQDEQSLPIDHDGHKEVITVEYDKKHNTNNHSKIDNGHTIENPHFRIKNDRSVLTVDIDNIPINSIDESNERTFTSTLTMCDEHRSSDSDVSCKFSWDNDEPCRLIGSISSKSVLSENIRTRNGSKTRINENRHKTTIPKCILEHLRDHNVKFHIVKICDN